MNTLKYKALLIKQCFIIFFRALGIYLLLTLPTVFLLPVYLISAFIAFIVGWIAQAFFVLFVWLLSFSASPGRKMPLVYVAVALGVLLAFQTLSFTDAIPDIWQSGPCLLLPLMALGAGWIALHKSQRKLELIMAFSRRRNHSLQAVL